MAKEQTRGATMAMGATNARLELLGRLLSWRLRMFDSAHEIGQASRVYITDCHHFEIFGGEPGHMKSRVFCQQPIGGDDACSLADEDGDAVFADAVEQLGDRLV